MDSTISFSIWAILVGFGSFHGVFLSVVFMSKIKEQKANLLFALLLLSVSYNLFEYTFAISGLYRDFPHLMATSYPFLFLMGPLFYFYAKQLTEPNFKVKGKYFLHFSPFLICLFFLIPFYLSGTNAKMEFLKTIPGENGIVEIPLGQYVFMGAHFLQTLIYMYLAKRMLLEKERLFTEQFSDGTFFNFSILNRMTSIIFWFFILCLVVLALLPVVKLHRVELDYVLMIILTVLIHATGYFALHQPSFFTQSVTTNDKEKYATYKLTDDQSRDLHEKIVEKIETEQLYLKTDYKISNLSNDLDIPVHYLSQVINEVTKTNFFEFINSFRIKRAKELLSNEDYSNHKIIAVAFDSGFSNKSTFNRIFKKYTGYTPSDYRDKVI